MEYRNEIVPASTKMRNAAFRLYTQGETCVLDYLEAHLHHLAAGGSYLYGTDPGTIYVPDDSAAPVALGLNVLCFVVWRTAEPFRGASSAVALSKAGIARGKRSSGLAGFA